MQLSVFMKTLACLLATLALTIGQTGLAQVPAGVPGKIGRTVIVPASALKGNPITIGRVTLGQTVTIVPKKVWWSGGGTKKGHYCDWRGYDPDKAKGIPWMALVAAVGLDEHWAKDNTLSFVVPANGTLVLYANDEAPGNSGSAEVTVTIEP